MASTAACAAAIQTSLPPISCGSFIRPKPAIAGVAAEFLRHLRPEIGEGRRSARASEPIACSAVAAVIVHVEHDLHAARRGLVEERVDAPDFGIVQFGPPSVGCARSHMNGRRMRVMPSLLK